MPAGAPGLSVVFSTWRRGKLGNMRTEWTKNNVPVELREKLFDDCDPNKELLQAASAAGGQKTGRTNFK